MLSYELTDSSCFFHLFQSELLSHVCIFGSFIVIEDGSTLGMSSRFSLNVSTDQKFIIWEFGSIESFGMFNEISSTECTRMIHHWGKSCTWPLVSCKTLTKDAYNVSCSPYTIKRLLSQQPFINVFELVSKGQLTLLLGRESWLVWCSMVLLLCALYVVQYAVLYTCTVFYLVLYQFVLLGSALFC